ncbi:hypothetical protein BCD49_16480 [Pseudofrankia sp. EUN1h]|nr:hypothetical protein BCD49_16480 [Pseudofrankia sp. EUN1h]
MLEMDVPMPAGSDGGARAASAPWMTWVEDRRRLVIGAAFGLAVVLGIVIGLATAPDGNTSAEPDSAGAAAAARSPQLPPLDWEGKRSPGTAVNMKVGDELRPALTWATADAALAKAGKTTLSAAVQASGSTSPAGSAGAQSATGGAELTADSITIRQGDLYYGAVEGSSAATDEFWAAGLTETSNTAVSVAKLHVWKRVGAGPWTEVASGAGACGRVVPKTLLTIWGPPALCASQS